MNSVLVGMFDSQADAQKARTALLSSGFDASDISVTQGSESSDTSSTMAAAPVEHEGSISHFFKKLFGADTDESDTYGSEYSHKYNEAFRRGHYIVSVTTVDEAEVDRAEQVMNAAGALDIDERAQQWQESGWTGSAATTSPDLSRAASVAPETGSTATAGSQTLTEVEEQLKVGKRSVVRGGVRVFTRLEELPVQETVHLREEQADIQRRAVDRPASESDLSAFKEGSIELRNTAEEAVVSKTARVVGEVEIGKRVTERDEVVSDTVRKTRVDVERMEGDPAMASADVARESRSYTGTTADARVGSTNRDPLSGELGAHPVGTGVGAAAGGIAAGAAAGSVAGPIGTVAGAAVGAVVGGLAGKEVAEKADPTIEDRGDKRI